MGVLGEELEGEETRISEDEDRSKMALARGLTLVAMVVGEL